MATTIGMLLAMTLALITGWPTPALAQERERNTCEACHTTASRLLAITQALAKDRPPVAASLSEGEG